VGMGSAQPASPRSGDEAGAAQARGRLTGDGRPSARWYSVIGGARAPDLHEPLRARRSETR
jgi:hypothetical protein